MKHVLSISIAVLAASLIAQAATIRVPADQPTIQSGINAAVSGDTVLVAPGIYSGWGNTDLVIQETSIHLRSEGGAATCLIDCSGTDRAILVTGWGYSSIIEGFTISNCSGGADAAVYCNTTEGTTTIRSCTISHHAFTSGAAIYASGDMIVEDSVITDNDCIGIQTEFACRYPEIVRCIIMNNTYTGISSMGYSSGGGECYPEIDDCLIAMNGSGIACYFRAIPTITRCVITQNNGLGISMTAYCPGTVQNCLITDNLGSGIACYNGVAVTGTVISNCTITGNSGDTGGGVAMRSSTALLTDSILWGNSAAQGAQIAITEAGSSLTIQYSDVQGGAAGVYTDPDTNLYWESGNMDSDPQFISGPGGACYLSQVAAGQASDSPCFNSGSDAASDICFNTPDEMLCMSDLTTRTDLVPDSGMSDMGYHYSVVPVPTATPTVLPCIHDGDVNDDGQITASDAQTAFLIAMGLVSPTGEQVCAADCNADGNVTAGDAQAIFIAALGLGECVD
ncbi:right-handed parallel beta-helix repeat-containing protein [bacterium]|nr:right-handed parallel beta-helix repeat-containing protein [candidate division CSSED10-310 bacterium]